MQLLKKVAKDMVSVLLNVFSKMTRESRGMVGDVIGIWVGIMTEKASVVDSLHLAELMDSAGHHRYIHDGHLPSFHELGQSHTCCSWSFPCFAYYA